MAAGDPGMKSAGPLAFGPDGILFAADPKGATVFAFATGDTDSAGDGALDVQGIDAKIGALLGIGADEVMIVDLAVNPASGRAYLSVARGKGPDAPPALICVSPGGEVGFIDDLGALKHSKLELADAPEDAVTGEGRRRSNKRLESITDLAYTEGRVAVAGLSNEEFASTLRYAPFPFGDGDAASASVEIYHGAHGKLETHSPIRTFVPMVVGGEPSIVASYTCTPLVTIPIKKLEPDAHVKGRTVAELGNRNRPLDMIEYESGGGRFLLIANSARGIMKVSTADIATVDSIASRVEGGGAAGLSYETVDGWDGVTQLDKAGAKFAVVVRESDGGQHLEQRPLP